MKATMMPLIYLMNLVITIIIILIMFTACMNLYFGYCFVYTELTPRTVGEAFYNGELEDELCTIGKVDYRFKYDSDREVCMEMVEEHRRETPYPHPDSQCTEDCKSRGILHNS